MNTRTILNGWSVAAPAGCELGERPIWDERTGSVVWVDILTGSVHRSAVGGHPSDLWSDEAAQVGAVLGAVALRSSGGLVAGADSAILMLDAAGRMNADPVQIELPDGSRFNDGACDPAGRFLIGSTASGQERIDGVLWSLDPVRNVRPVLVGLIEPNGLDWSPDGRTLYFIDSAEPLIRRYAYDPQEGVIRGRQTDLASVGDGEGVPDGLVIDSNGCVWVALWGGGALRRYAPDGDLLQEMPTPVSQPTCPCFAGPQLDQLVLTSAWQGLTTAQREAEPWAGHLLWSRTSVRGRLPFYFGA